MKIKIDNEIYEVDKIYTGGYLPLLKCGSREFYVAADSEEAGKAARKYWEDMKDNDKAEFRCLIGDERLIQWACNESDSFGIGGFEEFLEVTATVPEEQFASYDGQERDCEIVPDWEGEPDPAYYECEKEGEPHLHEWGWDRNQPCEADTGAVRDEENLEHAKTNDEVLSWEDWQERQEWIIEDSELYSELGFTPTVAYRHN